MIHLERWLIQGSKPPHSYIHGIACLAEDLTPIEHLLGWHLEAPGCVVSSDYFPSVGLCSLDLDYVLDCASDPKIPQLGKNLFSIKMVLCFLQMSEFLLVNYSFLLRCYGHSWKLGWKYASWPWALLWFNTSITSHCASEIMSSSLISQFSHAQALTTQKKSHSISELCPGNHTVFRMNLGAGGRGEGMTHIQEVVTEAQGRGGEVWVLKGWMAWKREFPGLMRN